MTIVWFVLIFIVGFALGVITGVFYLKKQMEKMQTDPNMLAKMAKQMGYNLNNKQLQQAKQMMNRQKRK